MRRALRVPNSQLSFHNGGEVREQLSQQSRRSRFDQLPGGREFEEESILAWNSRLKAGGVAE